MKVAITAEAPSLDSAVDERFGRADWFAIAETETGAVEFVPNDQNANAQQGAGIQAAQTLASRGVKALCTGHCGPKAFRVLRAAGIRVYTGAQGTVRDVLKAFGTGSLVEASGPDVGSHWT